MNWQSQKDEPLFPDVIWSRPETKKGRGKLLIIGGSAGAMSNVASSFTIAQQSGAGTIYLLVPDSLEKLTKHIPEIEYAPSNQSGSFARNSLDKFIDMSRNVEGVLFAGDIGKNSETSLMLESFLNKYQGLVFIDSKSLESFTINFEDLLSRGQTVLFTDFSQLQNIGKQLKLEIPFTSDMGRKNFAEALHQISSKFSTILVCEITNNIWVAHGQEIIDADKKSFQSTKATVWGIQQPTKLPEAIVSSFLD